MDYFCFGINPNLYHGKHLPVTFPHTTPPPSNPSLTWIPAGLTPLTWLATFLYSCDWLVYFLYTYPNSTVLKSSWVMWKPVKPRLFRDRSIQEVKVKSISLSSLSPFVVNSGHKVLRSQNWVGFQMTLSVKPWKLREWDYWAMMYRVCLWWAYQWINLNPLLTIFIHLSGGHKNARKITSLCGEVDTGYRAKTSFYALENYNFCQGR